MNKILTAIFIISLLSGCSEQYYMRKLSNTPRLPIQGSEEYKSLNKYQKDILYLTELLESTHPALFENYSKKEFEKDKKDLLLKFEKEEDRLLYISEIQRFLAKIKDGHTYIDIDDLFSKKKFPVWFKWFGNDLYIISAVKTDSSLIGSKVISINDKPVSEVISLLMPFHSSENEFYSLYEMEHYFFNPEYLYYNSVSSSLDSLRLKVFSEKFNYKEVTIPAVKDDIEWILPDVPKPVTAHTGKTYSYQILSNNNLCYFQFNDFFDKVIAVEGIKESFNPFLRLPARLFFHFYAKKHETVAFADFLKQMFSDIDKSGVENMVIDLRYNGGGQNTLAKQFLYYIETNKKIKDFTILTKISEAYKKQYPKEYKEYNLLYQEKYGRELPNELINLAELKNDTSFFEEVQNENSPYHIPEPENKFKGKIYLLTNSKTFSAASDFAVLLRDNELCTIVGAPTGHKPTKPTGVIYFQLPNTKIYGSVSHVYSIRPDTTKNTDCCLFPDIAVEPTVKEYLNRRDPAFEFILNETNNKK